MAYKYNGRSTDRIGYTSTAKIKDIISRTGLKMMLGHKTSKPFISCEQNLEYFTLPLRIPYNHMINQ